MKTLKITIECTEREIGTANFLLGQGFESAISNAAFLEQWGISEEQLKYAEMFWIKLVKAYFKAADES